MDGAGILFVGMLVVIAVLMLTSAIIALAPYVAGAIVIVVLCWLVWRWNDKPEIIPDDQATPPNEQHKRE